MTPHYHEGSVDHPPLAAGSVLALGYEIVEHLHQSNNFDVYDVWSEERACRSIAKVPRQDLLEDAKVRRGLLREGRLLKKLTHPHIVRLYESLEEPQPTLILETLTGETLSYIIDNNYRRLPVSDVAHLGLHLCSAIHYLHGHGILHLDLKPSNIVSERGLAKILDLSIAQPPKKSKKGAGTKQYMAPEQVRGELVGPAPRRRMGHRGHPVRGSHRRTAVQRRGRNGLGRRLRGRIRYRDLHGDRYGPRRLRAGPAHGRSRTRPQASPGRLREGHRYLPRTGPRQTPDAGRAHQEPQRPRVAD